MNSSYPLDEATTISPPAVQIRGIYGTALTCVLLDLAYPIANPSQIICDRLHISSSPSAPNVQIDDRADLQGVCLGGDKAAVHNVSEALTHAIPQAMRVPGPHKLTLIFGQVAKEFLDKQRRRVLPTVGHHHLLKSNRVPGIERLERDKDRSIAELQAAGEELWQSAMVSAYRSGKAIKITHAKPWKRDVTMIGIVESFVDGLLTVKRHFRGGGRYDSLNVPKLEGDWGRIEVFERSSILRRTYYRAGGRMIGELYNIQTPAEIGPAGVWYVDLEVDVVRRPDGTVSVVDLEELDRLARSGAVEPSLIAGARSLAEDLADLLRQGSDRRRLAHRSLR